jgi:hypothetical protein
VLIRVRGALAGQLLGFESGLWHFKRPPENRVEVLELATLADAYDIPLSMLCPESPPKDDAYAIPPARKANELRLETPARSWTVLDTRWHVTHAEPRSCFEFAALTDYAGALERVQFAARAAAALATEEG